MILLRRTIVLALAAAFLLLIHMLLLAGAAPIVRTAYVPLPGWPAGTKPIRIAFLSDSHMSIPGDTPGLLHGTVARINALRPDIVLIGGDFLSTDAIGVVDFGPYTSLAPFDALDHRHAASFAVLGNHDYAQSGLTRRAIKTAHIKPLKNEAARFGPLAIIGVADANSEHADVPAAIAAWHRIGGIPIVFTHSPDSIPNLPPGIALAFAGHTHCGQIALPLWGPLITQSAYGDRYACGIVHDPGRTAIVTAGLGTSNLPLRLGSRPDLWLVMVGP